MSVIGNNRCRHSSKGILDDTVTSPAQITTLKQGPNGIKKTLYGSEATVNFLSGERKGIEVDSNY